MPSEPSTVRVSALRPARARRLFVLFGSASFALGVAIAAVLLGTDTLRAESVRPAGIVLGLALALLVILWLAASRKQRDIGLLFGGPLAAMLVSSMPVPSIDHAAHPAAPTGSPVETVPGAPLEGPAALLDAARGIQGQRPPSAPEPRAGRGTDLAAANGLESAARLCSLARRVVRFLTPTIDEDPETLPLFLEPLRRGVDVEILAWDVRAANAEHVAADLGLPIELIHAHGRRLDAALRQLEDEWNRESVDRAIRELPTGRLAVRRSTDLPRARLLIADPGSNSGAIAFTPILSATPGAEQPVLWLHDPEHATSRAIAASFSRLWSRTFRREAEARLPVA